MYNLRNRAINILVQWSIAKDSGLPDAKQLEKNTLKTFTLLRVTPYRAIIYQAECTWPNLTADRQPLVYVCKFSYIENKQIDKPAQ